MKKVHQSHGVLSLLAKLRPTLPNNHTQRKVFLKVLLLILIVSSGFSLFRHGPATQSTESPSNTVLKYLVSEKEINQNDRIFTDSSASVDYERSLLDFERSHLKYIYPEVIDSIYEHTELNAVDWSRYAYVVYATSTNHLCNAMLILSELRRSRTRAKLVMLVKREFLTEPLEYRFEHDALLRFSSEFDVQVKPTEVIRINQVKDKVWMASFTKLMVFGETDYDRIIYMDSDALLPKGHLDELFFIPPCKIAVPAAYWLIDNDYKNLNSLEKYSPAQYGFRPLTSDQRTIKLNDLIDKTIIPFLSPSSNKLDFNEKFRYSSTDSLEALSQKVNQRNFYTNIYNELPNYVTTDEFKLTNIVMVIQPSEELYESMKQMIENRESDEYDMDLLQHHLFNPKKIIERQTGNKLDGSSNELSFAQRFLEIPELLILPHQVYGALSSELNIVTNHVSFMADPQDQLFASMRLETSTHEPAYYEIDATGESAGQIMYERMKYIHFSDSPIPKPGFAKQRHANYMSHRARCSSHSDFQEALKGTHSVVPPKVQTSDCSAGTIWENIHKKFQELRKDVCHLDLIDHSNMDDTYKDDIN